MRAWANEALGHAEYSPNYLRLLEHGDATDVGDMLAAGDEAAVLARLRSFRDAGVTDLAARVLPLGADRDAADRVEARATLALAAPRCARSSEPGPSSHGARSGVVVRRPARGSSAATGT